MAERKPVKEQVKEHPVIATIAALGILAGGVNVTTVVQAVRTWDNLATKAHVAGQIAEAEARIDGRLTQHASEADRRFDHMEDGQNRIRAFVEIVPELKDLLTLRCMGTPNLDVTIDRLKDEYEGLTGENYREPTCDRLLARAF